MSRPTGCPFDPPAEFTALRAEEPISRVRLWNGKLAWLVTRYDDVRAVLSDPRFSSDMSKPGFPSHSEGVAVTRTKHPTFLNMDDPEHAVHRRMLTRDFMIKRVEALRPRIQQHVDELLDQFTAGPQPADLVTGFALPVTSSVISELLGVPYEDHEFFQRQSGLLISGTVGPEEAMVAFDSVREYLRGLVERKAVEPAQDVISHLIEIERAGSITRDELLNMLSLLLRAGHETTANMIALGTLALLEHPAQLAALKADPSPTAVANAVEELLRYLTITHYGRRRVATEDVEIGGTLIRAGEGVVAANDSANRDPDAFPGNPDELDLGRAARHHLTFGYGVHQCLGQPLARVELQVVYPTLLRRLPELRVAVPVSELPFKTHMVFYGLFSMPVEW
ncbi:cytochrome P450 [Saccharopolyspora sp. K220]|uniref:cytochrome P450 n=1 Tax=Saccharopolyspora soli TaxID=2926618 RepID=UPI001F5AF7EB|nr:cytochrome P450 [Saccharopolyspora soli]MCI2422564.1 cytochrome P450 [Saccharopolyspora soli]